MKQLKNCKCIELRCIDCPLRIFGCTALQHSNFHVCEEVEKWSRDMTLDEILDERINAVKDSIRENPVMKLVFGNAVACAKIALLNYIDEEGLLQDD